MKNDLKILAELIEEASRTINSSPNATAFTLGRAYQLSVDMARDIEENEAATITNKAVFGTCSETPEPSAPVSLKDYCERSKTETHRHRSLYGIKMMSLATEIDRRWNRDSIKKVIHRILSGYGIDSIYTFMKFYDNPENVIKIREDARLSSDDKMALFDMYMASQEEDGTLAYTVYRQYVGSTRTANALGRSYNIHSKSQLFYYIYNNGNIPSTCGVSNAIISELNDKVRNDPDYAIEYKGGCYVAGVIE